MSLFSTSFAAIGTDTIVSVLGFNIIFLLSTFILIAKVLFAKSIIELFPVKKLLPIIPCFLMGKFLSTKLNSVLISCPCIIKGIVILPNVCIALLLIPFK